MRRKNFLIALAFAAVTVLTLRFTIGPRHWGHHGPRGHHCGIGSAPANAPQ
ncbi:MAG: hypothetical protein IT230_01555 [Flavobacteriales bacterium]|nr:hypothetical protein [Flavobacteriales bacterium]